MKIDSLLQEINNLSIKIYLSEGKLKLKAKEGNIPSSIIEKVKNNKSALIDYLQNFEIKDQFSIINAEEKKYCYPLSSAQKRLYLLQQIEPGSIAYNMPFFIPLDKNANKERIKYTLEKLIERHDILRTIFLSNGEYPIQVIKDKVLFEIEEYKEDKIDTQKLRETYIRPFNLSKAPLIRAAIFETDGEGSMLMLDIHHIIIDGLSHQILKNEFEKIYSGEELPQLQLQYKDYCLWQNSNIQQDKIKSHEAYWLEKLQGEIPALNLPLDYSRPMYMNHEGSTVNVALSIKETGIVKDLAKAHNLTLYMSLLSIYTLLLSKLSGQKEILIGTPISGRNNPDLENMVGMFVNTLPLKILVTQKNKLQDFLESVKRTVLDAFDNQECQFEDLVDKLSIERDLSRNPIFDVMFNLLNHTDFSGDLKDFNSVKEHISDISKFDLSLTAIDYGQQILLKFNYCNKLFKPETIDRYIKYFVQLISEISNRRDEFLDDYELISDDEKQKILDSFNDTDKPYSKNNTIIDLFEKEVDKTPCNIALKFGELQMTYSELNDKADRLAGYLIKKGVGTGSVVAVMLDRSFEMMVSIFGILKAGGAYLPIAPNYPFARIKFMLKDSEAKFYLTNDANLDNRFDFLEGINVYDESIYKDNECEISRKITPNSLAYVIYTSGTTGNPKGVMIEHHSVLNRIEWMQKAYPIGEKDTILQKTPYTFDVSVWELFWWSFQGACLAIADPGDEREPQKLIGAIEKFQANVIHFVPSMFDVFLHFVDENKSKGKLKHLKYIFTSGEALKVNQVEKFFESNDLPTRLINLYGPTEATVDVSYFECLRNQTYDTIPIGKPIDNIKLYIVDPEYKPVPIGVVGELCIAGVGLARGYLKRDELTTEKFVENPFDKGSKLYKTGDLARWREDGNIEFIGRIDHQVKIRGLRIELGEIENALIKHDKIKECAVLVKSSDVDKYLCAYIACSESVTNEELKNYLCQHLMDYMVPTHFITLETLPLTSSGKVDRKALPEPELNKVVAYEAPQSVLEERLVEIWEEVLKIPKENISVTANFFAIGGHSLKATILNGKVHKWTGVEIPLKEIFTYNTIRKQAQQIELSAQTKFSSIPNSEKCQYYPLSPAQKRLYILQEIEPESTAYNLPYFIKLEKNADINKIKKVMQTLMNRHESLRTIFIDNGESTVQFIEPSGKIDIEEYTIDESEIKSLREKFVCPFNLSQYPIVRAVLINISNGSKILMIDMHHIITDGVSQDVLEYEFSKLYSGYTLEPVRLQYKDFSKWQNTANQQEKIKQQADYWINLFKGEIPILNLPADYVRPALQSHVGATVKFSLTAEESLKIKEISKENGATLYMSLLAIYSIMLHKLSGQNEIIIGTPVAGRNHTDLEKTVGMFVNTIALKNNILEDDSFESSIENVKRNALEAFQNQDYPFEDLLESVEIERDPGRNPLFDVVFNLVEQTDQEGDFSQANNQEFQHTIATSKFDITLAAFDFGDRVMLRFEYCTKLFESKTIERFIKYFFQIVKQISNNPRIKIKDIDILGKEETDLLLHKFNDTKASYPKEKLINEIFEEQVNKSPEEIALKLGEDTMTYGELNQRSNQIARHLRSQGVKPDTIVGIIMDRSFEMIVGIMGILKAGGAYLPIDPEYPEERINYTQEDSKAKIFLSVKKYANLIKLNKKILLLDEEQNYTGNSENLDTTNNPDNLAYVIYTSGTTGKPKGSLIEHRNVVRLLFNDKFQFDFSKKDVWTLFHSYCFDFSVWEMYGALLYGGKLIIVPDSVKRDPFEYRRLLIKEKVTVLNQTPSSFYNLVNVDLESEQKDIDLKYVIFGGEALKPLKLKKWKEKYSQTKLINMYGITETTVHVTYKEITENEINSNISNIGKPIPTLTVYILDKNMKLVPVGVPGEICVGGDGVCRGYLYRQDLTNQKFVRNPYNTNEILYRSGDLGKISTNGEIEYLGRLDHQVKIRGFRIELGEIESQLLKIEGINEVIVLDKTNTNDEKYLSAYYVRDKDVKKGKNNTISNIELRQILSEILPDYMIPSYFVELDQMPITSNGKIDRKALPEPKVETKDEIISPETDQEKQMVKIWSEILDADENSIGLDTNYFTVGGDSMKAIRLISKINSHFNSKLKIPDIYHNQTIQHLLSVVNKKDIDKESEPDKEKIREKLNQLKIRILASDLINQKDNIEDIYPMSDIEKGMVYSSMINPDLAVYHDQFIYQLKFRSFNFARFKKALSIVVEKHHILRTSFNVNDFEESVQIVNKNIELDLLQFDISMKDSSSQENHIMEFLQKNRATPFDVGKAPLWRMRIFNLDEDNIVSTWSFHHAILDGWSNASLMTELNNTYIELGKNPNFVTTNLKSSYKDYIVEHLLAKKSQEIHNYWIGKLSDYKRFVFPEQDNESSKEKSLKKIGMSLGAGLFEKLEILGSKYNTSVKHICFAAYSYMLNMLSYENDIVTGLVSNNRPPIEDGDKIIGCFLNTVPVRIKTPLGISCKDYIKLIDSNIIELKKYDKLSLLEIKKIVGEKSKDENPFFDTIFNYVDFHIYGDAKKESNENEGQDSERKYLNLDGFENTNTLFDLSIIATLGSFTFSLVYSNRIVSDLDAKKFSEYFVKILNRFIESPETILRKSDILSIEEKQFATADLNKTFTDYPDNKNIFKIFEETVEKNPNQTFVSYKDRSFTYDEINRKSNQLARKLRELGVTSGHPVGLISNRSEELIIGILGILKCGGAYLPLNTDWPMDRINYMLEDSCCKIIVCDSQLEELNFNREIVRLGNRELDEKDDSNLNIELASSSPVYIIYTSGTTGKPKGVLTTHSNVMRVVLNTNYVNIQSADKILQLSSYTFDGSVFDIYGALLNGAGLELIDNEDILNIDRLTDLIARNQITMFFLTTALFNTMIDTDPKKLKDVNKILFGGERISVRHTYRAIEALGPDRLIHVYGPTETTVYASYFNINQVDIIQETIPIGLPISNTTMYILDNALQILPIGVTGEVYIGGKGNALGYMNNVELTSDKFIDNPFYKGGKLYKTGDLARRLPDGNIEFVGRIDHQIKIRGFRVELGEIETELRKHENIKECVVLARLEGNNTSLCAYIVLRNDLDKSEIVDFLSKSLPDFMIPTYFIKLDKLPLTTNGKVNRKALPEPQLNNETDFEAPVNEVEEKLVQIWSNVLNIEKSKISTSTDFFSIGGHSLTATALSGKIQRELDVEFPLKEIFIETTIKSQAENIKNKARKDYVIIPKVAHKDHYELSPAQKRMYLLQELDKNSIAYNMPYVITLDDNIETEQIKQVFSKLIERHESFRNSFNLINGELTQTISNSVEFELKEYNIKASDEEMFRRDFVIPFNLSEAPLLRAAVLVVDNASKMLFIDMHHIISDGVSQTILEDEFKALLQNEELPAVDLQYKDYSEWKNSKEQLAITEKQKIFWLEQFKGEVQPLELPLDFNRPAYQSFEGATVRFVLNKEETDIIKELADKHGLTTYMCLLSVYSILLSKLSGQREIIIGAPMAGRNHLQLEKIVGMFVNTLALKCELSDDDTLKDLFANIKNVTLSALENQDYQFEELVDQLSLSRDAGRNPVFDVIFNLLPKSEFLNQLQIIEDFKYKHIKSISKFDLSLTAVEAENSILLSFGYCTKLFKQETINRFIKYFRHIISQLDDKQDFNLDDIEILDRNEEKLILEEFNNTKTDYPHDKSIQELFKEQVIRTPELHALKDENNSYSYKDLDESSNQIANVLIEKGAKTGDLIGLISPRSIDMITAILGILKSGCAYVPIDPEYPVNRINHMLRESEPKLLLTDNNISNNYEYNGEDINFRSDEIKRASRELNIIRSDSCDVAYIMYTSGSTGNPKGVEIMHKSVVRLVKNTDYLTMDFEHRILQTGAPVFDATTFEIWAALLNGGNLFVPDKDVITNAHQLKDCILTNSITTMWLTSSLFNQLVDIDDTIFDSLKYLLVGGDVLSPKHINKIKNRSSKIEIINGYGPTENTTFSTTYRIDRHFEARIPIGKPISNSTAYIFNRKNKLQPIGVVGELVVGGDGLGRSYIKNQQLTNEKFIQNPFKVDEKLYKTGDLARWLPDGNIEFIGRADFQVKIRGFRIELGEIENLLLKHEHINEAIVLAFGETADKYLGAYVTSNNGICEDHLRNYLSQQLPDYMVPGHFVILDKFPLNSNGKIDRKALPMPQKQAGNKYIAPKTEEENQLINIWAEILNVDAGKISRSDNFFTIGGHSLKATLLSAKIHKEFGVELPLREIFANSTIEQQVIQIESSKKNKFRSIPRADIKEHYTLSSAQKRLFLLQQMDTESIAYNMPSTIPISHQISKDEVEDIFKQLIRRHELFRTSFTIKEGEPVQIIHNEVELIIEEHSLKENERISSQFTKPFDLSKAPLLRVAIIQNAADERFMHIDMHHIISDGVSHQILENEFNDLLSGNKLKDLKVRYIDYSEWQNSDLQKQKNKKLENYWLSKFKGEIPLLNLPIDYPRPAIQSHEGANVNFLLSKEETYKIKELSQKQGLTLYMTLLAVFKMLLSKLSGQNTIIVGSPVAGREHVDLDGVVGMFVNTVAQKTDVNLDETIEEYLERLKQEVINTFENQAYQFEDLVEKVAVSRNMGRNPIFDVMFGLQNQFEQLSEIAEYHKKGYKHIKGISKFDLTLLAVDYNEEILLTFEYCTKLFKPETIERYINYFKSLIKQATSNQNQTIGSLQILSENERELLIKTFNNTKIDYNQNSTIHKIFEAEVENDPGKIAVAYKGNEITYGELDKSANQLAHLLIDEGVTPETIIGIEMESSTDFVICMLAILKSGCAYLPIDKYMPVNRKKYIIENSKLRILLHDKDQYDEDGLSIKNFNYNKLDTNKFRNTSPDIKIDIDSLAYVIYTSGTSGNPKGTLLNHRGIVSENTFWKNDLGITANDRCLQFANISFDASVWEIFLCLLNGAGLFIVEKTIKDDHTLFEEFITTNKITVATLPPVFIENLNEESFKDFRLLVTAGSETNPNLIERFGKQTKYINAYGPTETSVCATYWDTSDYEKTGKVSIGKPIRNTQAYILDNLNNLQGIGIPGELCISGDGLARGYLYQEEITKEKFIPHPFKKGEKLYRTGDLARWLPDGNIEFLGRIDFQVKIRGYRIELAEIECVLQKSENIKTCVVIDRVNKNEKFLCAYIVPNGEFNNDEIVDYISSYLPAYMIPAHFVKLDKLPLNNNGKVDRTALPVPEITTATEYLAPRNNIEETLVKIWADLLSVPSEKLSINSNFFELGGNSLLIIKAVQKIKETTQFDIKVLDFFRYTSIKELTNFIQKKNDSQLDSAERKRNIDKGKKSMTLMLNKNKS